MVPNLAAKRIIDIDVVIESMEYLPWVIKNLDELGYVHEGDLGIKNREAFARKTFIYLTVVRLCKARRSSIRTQ
ncbi:GrpB family protein [Paenibacillus amylolyticus]|uniref:GrpB family protein n=1 Tax=Paenibacillus amylolyticus TaxID=1451 RepID=UPI003EB834BC